MARGAALGFGRAYDDVGQGAAAAVPVEEFYSQRSVSGSHATVSRGEGGEVTISDSSTYGATWVLREGPAGLEEVRCNRETRPLRVGDYIVLGDFESWGAWRLPTFRVFERE